MTIHNWQIEAAARALFERDMRRSIGMPPADYVWQRVAEEYRRAAKAALDAATSDSASTDEAPEPEVPAPTGEGRLL